MRSESAFPYLLRIEVEKCLRLLRKRFVLFAVISEAACIETHPEGETSVIVVLERPVEGNELAYSVLRAHP